MGIGEKLEGKRFFVTGSTGFLGTALVERILRCIPNSQVVLLVRPGRRATPIQRVIKEILKNDCFDRLRNELGEEFDSLILPRVIAVSGDVGSDGLGLDGEGRQLLATCDLVVHSAATVSFDAPLDQAVEINMLGPARLATALVDARNEQTRNGTALNEVHMIAVSTAYVAGTHQGEAKEQLLDENRFSLDADWREEAEAASRLRTELQSKSRLPEMLARFTKKARGELGGAGEHLLAARSEKLREDWIKDELVRAGTARASALGWPDAYPFTKALGERALVALHGSGSLGVRDEDVIALSIVRPSIIESALSEPRPGWIRGFRMAEPIIISYARGLLKEFPGVPEGVIDVIPVDLVVSTILAVAANGPEPGRPSVYHVASGVHNPLRYGRLVDVVQDWFGSHPLYDDRGQPINVPAWSFPGRGRVQRQLHRGDKLMTGIEQLISFLPLRGHQASFAANLEDKHALAKRALGYVELYGAYTETEARYRIDHLLELLQRQDPKDLDAFNFNPASIDWDDYIRNIHLPSIVEHARVRTTPGKSVAEKRSERTLRAVLAPERQLIVFDLEHTLMASNVVDTYAWLASRHLSGTQRVKFVAELVSQAPSLLALDRRDRGDFLRSFYRRYEDAPVEQLRKDAWELFHGQLLLKSFPAGFARVREHHRLGHHTLLITGALDFIIDPLRSLFDDIICASMGIENGRFTGRLEELPPIGEARAILLADYADQHGYSLEESVAYADSASDLAMLEAVGFPVAVNPESRLAAIARRRGWHVEHWSKAAGASLRPLPIGPLDSISPITFRLKGSYWKRYLSGDTKHSQGGFEASDSDLLWSRGASGSKAEGR